MQCAVETALLDLTARRADVPLSHLFGGAWRDRVAVDYWMGRESPARAVQCVRRAVALGFRGIKCKTTLEDENVQRLEAIRAEAGPDFRVTVDPNGRFYRLADAIATIRAMDAVGNMHVLEDPFPRHNPGGSCAGLQGTIRARLAAHLDPPEALCAVLREGHVDGLNIDSHTQGLWGWRPIRTRLTGLPPNTSYSKSMNTQICHRAGGLGLGLAEFIVSPANSFTTGFTFDLGGGRAVY